MRWKALALAALTACAATAAYRPDQRRHDQDRRHERPVRPLRRSSRPRAPFGPPARRSRTTARRPSAKRSKSSSPITRTSPTSARTRSASGWMSIRSTSIVDVPTSSVALAVNNITKEKNKVFLVSGAASSDLTGKACSPNTVHWTYDTWAARQRHRQRDRQDRRRFVVLPDRRLCLRSRARARYRGRRR